MRNYKVVEQIHLQRLVFLSCREALYAPAHPDSKRQKRCKQRDLARYGARVLKQSGVLTATAKPLTRKQDRRRIQRLWEQERKVQALRVAARLLGRPRGVSGWTSPQGVRYGH